MASSDIKVGGLGDLPTESLATRIDTAQSDDRVRKKERGRPLASRSDRQRSLNRLQRTCGVGAAPEVSLAVEDARIIIFLSVFGSVPWVPRSYFKVRFGAFHEIGLCAFLFVVVVVVSIRCCLSGLLLVAKVGIQDCLNET